MPTRTVHFQDVETKKVVNLSLSGAERHEEFRSEVRRAFGLSQDEDFSVYWGGKFFRPGSAVPDEKVAYLIRGAGLRPEYETTHREVAAKIGLRSKRVSNEGFDFESIKRRVERRAIHFAEGIKAKDQNLRVARGDRPVVFV